MRIEFSYPKGTIRGSIEYDEKTKEVTVSFPDPKKRKQIKAYLTTKQEFWEPVEVPEELGIVTDYVDVVNIKPIENLGFFLRALNQIWGHTGVWIHWNTEIK